MLFYVWGHIHSCEKCNVVWRGGGYVCSFDFKFGLKILPRKSWSWSWSKPTGFYITIYRHWLEMYFCWTLFPTSCFCLWRPNLCGAFKYIGTAGSFILYCSYMLFFSRLPGITKRFQMFTKNYEVSVSRCQLHHIQLYFVHICDNSK